MLFEHWLTIAPIVKARLVDSLIEKLKHKDPKIRREAALSLGKMEEKDPRAVEPLIAALKDNNWGVREAAAWALGEMKDHRAIIPLIEILKDESGYVRERAIKALWKIFKTGDSCVKDTCVVESLIEVLGEENPKVRKFAVLILLGRVKKPSCGGTSD